MPDLYPTDKEITIFGEKVKYPGLDQNGKFTNGSFTDPKQLASFIPAETLNLILDNLSEAIKSVGLEPNNIDTDQLAKAISFKAGSNIVLSDRIENAINLSTNEELQLTTPNENGIIYSDTVDLKQLLADKLNQKKENIKIIDWNIINTREETLNTEGYPVYNNQSIFTNRDNINNLYFNLQPLTQVIRGKEDFILAVQGTIPLKDLHFAIAIQIADELTEDIKDLNIKRMPFKDIDFSILSTNILQLNKNKRDCIKAAQRYKSSILYNTSAQNGLYSGNEDDDFSISTDLLSDTSLYSVVYSVLDFSMLDNPQSTITPSTTSSDYFYSHASINCVSKPTNKPVQISTSASIYNSSIFDSSLILFHGDKIKINIKSLETPTPIYMKLNTKYDVAVRYSIVGI